VVRHINCRERGEALRAEHVDAFLTSAFEVLGKTVDARPERGSPVLRSGEALSSRELTVLVALHGQLAGVIFYSMSLATAMKLGGVLCQRHVKECGDLDGEAIGILAHMMSKAGVECIAEHGCLCKLEDPLLVLGFGEPLTGVSPLLLVPLYTEYGDIDIGVALIPEEQLTPDIRLVAVRSAALRDSLGEHAYEEPAALRAPAAEPVVEEAAPQEETTPEPTPEPEAEAAPTTGDELSDKEQAEWEAALAALEAEEAAETGGSATPPATETPEPETAEPEPEAAAEEGPAPSLADILARAQAEGKLQAIGSNAPASSDEQAA